MSSSRSTYPADWRAVADRLEDDPGRAIVLPWAGSYRGFDWNDRRAVLDPAPRFLPGEVLIDDRVFVDGTVIPSEDPLVDDVRRALADDDPAPALRELGVRWVAGREGDAVRTGARGRDGVRRRRADPGRPRRGRARSETASIRTQPSLILAGHVARRILVTRAVSF